MSTLRRQAMDAVLAAASHDIDDTIKDQGIESRHDEDADGAVFDVAILYAYRVFVRICEQEGLTVSPEDFAELAAELVEEIAEDTDV